MNDLTEGQRAQILERDRERCLRCGGRPPTLQHRRAKGMGGRGKKAVPLTCADGVALCLSCNERAEGNLQQEALRYGWKIPRLCPMPAQQIPYYDRLSGSWWLPDVEGGRTWVDPGWAAARVAVALAL